jgi:biotin synthase
MPMEHILNKIDNDIELNRNDLKDILSITEPGDLEALFDKASEVKKKFVGSRHFYRGIIEFSNICNKDCYYCGIRRSNKNIDRYMMKEAEIIEGAELAYRNNYGSIVLQSGERNDSFFINFITNVLRRIKEVSDGKLGITISLGEQSREVYKEWFDAGAHRYLLRIETSNPELYKRLHPEDHDFGRRKNCLHMLRDIGYQVGTGVMIGLPGQTRDDLVNDLMFFKDTDIDMIGMGPYIVHKDTPAAESIADFEAIKSEQFLLGLKMISAARLFLRDVNIASTTALQTLNPNGREMGLRAGANIIMPNITDEKYRESYQLYDNKPCVDEDPEKCLGCLEKRIFEIDEEIGYGEWGDSPHFKKRTAN